LGAYNSREKIVAHYDFVSPFYNELWGEHLHHGYWRTGEETKEDAQEALVDQLAQAAPITRGTKVLDVGCGVGGSSIHLARRYGAESTGITISPVQVQMARTAADRAGVNVRFLLMDAQAITLSERFDLVFSIESVSHYENKGAFFRRLPGLVHHTGRVVLIDWFKHDDLSAAEYRKYIVPIEKGMLVELHPIADYVALLEANGLAVERTEDMSEHTARTWQLALDILNGDSSLWAIARNHSAELVYFLRAFRAMRAAFRARKLVYGMIVARP